MFMFKLWLSAVVVLTVAYVASAMIDKRPWFEIVASAWGISIVGLLLTLIWGMS